MPLSQVSTAGFFTKPGEKQTPLREAVQVWPSRVREREGLRNHIQPPGSREGFQTCLTSTT